MHCLYIQNAKMAFDIRAYSYIFNIVLTLQFDGILDTTLCDNVYQ